MRDAGIGSPDPRGGPQHCERPSWSPHWGATYEPVNWEQQQDAELAFDRGVDGIVGHHGHAAQRFELVDGTPVAWGLGNAAFGTRGRFGEEPGYGLVARLVVAGGAIVRLELVPIRVNNRRVDYRVEPCPLQEADEVLRSLNRGDVASISDGVATLTPGG